MSARNLRLRECVLSGRIAAIRDPAHVTGMREMLSELRTSARRAEQAAIERPTMREAHQNIAAALREHAARCAGYLAHVASNT